MYMNAKSGEKTMVTFNKRHIFILVVFIFINLLTLFVVLPYTQRAANAHMNEGAFLGVIYFILAGLTAVFATDFLKRHRDKKTGLGILFIILTFILWGLKLYSSTSCIHI